MSRRYTLEADGKTYSAKVSPRSPERQLMVSYMKDGELKQTVCYLTELIDTFPETSGWRGFTKDWWKTAIPEIRENLDADEVCEAYIATRDTRRSVSLKGDA